MTLCMAWVRQVGDTEELVIASDSRLRFGGYWDGCPKILTLPRTDCVLAFAGDTQYAYPLMLQVSEAIRLYPKAQKRVMDIHDLKGHMIRVINGMNAHVFDLPPDEKKPGTAFLFGGYSWRQSRFVLWLIHYDPELAAFTYRPATEWKGSGEKRILFAGDDLFEDDDLAEEGDDQSIGVIQDAKKRLVALLRKRDKLTTGSFDMEPFEVLVDIIRSKAHVSVGGAPQMAKVYRHMNSEVFAVYWPNRDSGEISVSGRALLDYEKPHTAVLDPDTATVVPK